MGDMANSSDVGSPMAGATDPASYRRMSDLGTSRAGQAPSGMQRLDGNLQATPQQLGEVKAFKPQDFGQQPNTQASQEQAEPQEMVNLETLDESTDPEAQEMVNLEVDDSVQGEVLSAEEAAAKFKEWQESPDLPEEFLDKVFWYDSDGKGNMQPIRMRDLPNNILMYNDYQRKTAEVGERNRKLDRLVQGHRMLSEDVKSGDPQRGLRAWRYMGGAKTLEAMVMQYVNERAELEQLPQHVQARLLREQTAEDELYYTREQMLMLQRERDAETQRQQQQQGADAPDIQFVQQHILNTLPSVYQKLGISKAESESEAFVYELERVFARAAEGTRASDGTYTTPPQLQRGRTPSNRLLEQLVTVTKQGVDKMLARGYRQTPPKRLPPVNTSGGTGPAAKPGQRGNMGQPQRKRWSDMR